MSKLLSTRETVSLLEQLRLAIREFTQREENLLRAQSRALNDADARHRQEHDRAKDAAAREIAETRRKFNEAREAVHARFAARERRLADAHGSARRKALEDIQHTEDRRKYAVQKGTLDVERWRDDALARNDAALADFHGRLAQNREHLAELERHALAAFRGYRRWRKPLVGETPPEPGELNLDHSGLLERLNEIESDSRTALAQFRRQPLPRLFRVAPLWTWFVLALLCAFGLAPALHRLNLGEPTIQQTGAAAGIGFALVLALFLLGSRAKPLALRIARNLSRARSLHNLALSKSQSWHAAEIERINQEAKERAAQLRAEWDTAIRESATARETRPAELEEKWRRIRARNDQWLRQKTSALATEETEVIRALEASAATRLRDLEQRHKQEIEALNQKQQLELQELTGEWQRRIDPIFSALDGSRATSAAAFPDWNSPRWSAWTPPAAFENFAPFARVEGDVAAFAGAVPSNSHLRLPVKNFDLPLLLSFPREGSLVLEAAPPGRETALAALNNVIFRLLAGSPAGKLSFTIFDPVSLGESFAGITHLADFEAALLNGRIWTRPDQIEERLSDLNEHMEKVIQMYLRNEYETIAEYNRAAGNIAEKYHFVVLADFPANLTENAQRRLLRIASIGGRCGVYLLIHFNPRQGAMPENLAEALRQNSLWLKHTGAGFVLSHPPLSPARVIPDLPPPAETGNALLEKIGRASQGAGRVEVPFTQVAPPPGEIWSLNSSEEVRIPIGRAGPNKLQYLSMGRGTRQHALVAGKTGSGKSTLFHVMITNGALWYSPRELEFYLIDFKKGVEFKAYASRHLPHARVIAIESDREFAVSVLQRVADELSERGDLFRKAGVQDIAGYRKATGQSLPRTLLLIDEFQEFFVEEDRLAQSASLLLDRIVRQGRAFGIHVILGSQTLGGVYTLARSTIGQMVIRIGLQCNEADAYLIMDENNSAPRLLSRPGEGIYNDMSGASEANSPFQAVWLPENERDLALQEIHGRAQAERLPVAAPVVFEGNAPAELAENRVFANLLVRPAAQPAEAARIWLGAPNSIKEPTSAILRPRSGSNLLIVGQREEAIAAMISSALLSLAVQFPPGTARLLLLDGTAPESNERRYMDRLIAWMQHPEIARVNEDLEGTVQRLADDLNQRIEQRGAPGVRTFFIITGLQNFKKLRPEDEFSFSLDAGQGASAASRFTRIYTEGPSHGIHVIAAMDTYGNVNRFLGRKGLSEFSQRVLFQMSANDSASLCDDPRASRLGLYRALFFSEQEGTLETFRPYALPDLNWIENSAPAPVDSAAANPAGFI